MKRLILVLVVLITGCTSNLATVEISADDIKYIYDGDTITIKCLIGFECNNKGKISIRVLSVDTPEIKSSCANEKKLARKAKQHTVDFVRNAKSITLLYDKYEIYDRYGRLLADVIVDHVKLSKSLIEAGLGREYYGGKRQGWCD